MDSLILGYIKCFSSLWGLLKFGKHVILSASDNLSSDLLVFVDGLNIEDSRDVLTVPSYPSLPLSISFFICCKGSVQKKQG